MLIAGRKRLAKQSFGATATSMEDLAQGSSWCGAGSESDMLAATGLVHPLRSPSKSRHAQQDEACDRLIVSESNTGYKRRLPFLMQDLKGDTWLEMYGAARCHDPSQD